MSESTSKRKSEVIDGNNQPHCSKKQQTDINSFFGGKPKKQMPKDTTVNKSSKRTLKSTTAESWKTTSLAKYDAENWLVVNTDDSAVIVKSFNCEICTMFEDKIVGIPKFNYAWSRNGCVRLQHAAAVEHATSEPHKAAYINFLTNKGVTPRERTETLRSVLSEDNQCSIIEGFDTMDRKNVETNKKKFETAYFVVKEELPITKYKKILLLEEKHGVVLDSAYRNDSSAGIIIKYIADSIARELKCKLETAPFYSVLTDGSTDSSITEKEAIFVVTFDPSPLGSNKIGVNISFLLIVDLKAADSNGILESMEHAFENIGMEDWCAKLIGFGSDGASVNTGKKQGVKTLLQKKNKWITFGWCVAHRLELTLKTAFTDIDELVLRVYYLYKKSPKKLRQLNELVAVYEDVFDFQEGGNKPKKASGTRWIAHKVGALKLIVDKYGIFMQHLANLAENKSYPAKERSKFKGWYEKWTMARIPLMACLSIELLAPAMRLSKTFQSEDVDFVSVSMLLDQSKKQMRRLERKDFKELPTVKRFLDNVVHDNGRYLFQDVPLKQFEIAKESVAKQKDEWLNLVSEAISMRLENDESVASKYATTILNTDGWIRHTNDDAFADEALEELFNFYE